MEKRKRKRREIDDVRIEILNELILLRNNADSTLWSENFLTFLISFSL